MASTNQFYLFLLLITLSSSLLTHARDSQFFNKASAQQADFLSENENNYGLYARDSSQSLPSTTIPSTERLPRNYNPVAYVTFPESTGSFNSNPNNNYYSGRMSDTKNKFYNKNFFGNSENAYEFNGEGYQTQDEFEDDEVNNLPWLGVLIY